MTVDTITSGGAILAHVIRPTPDPSETTFYTPNDSPMQVGNVVYPAGGEVPAHLHLPVARHLTGTTEVIVVQSGRCEMRTYDDQRELVDRRVLEAGHIVVARGGGHGFSMLEDTVLLEVKQGPYGGLHEKERF